MTPPNDSSALAIQVPIPAVLGSIIPLAHHEEFYNRTTDEQRGRIALLIQMFDEIANSPDGVMSTCFRLALEHPARGFSAGNLKTLYYAYRKARDWRVLVPQYRGPESVPAEFVEYFRKRTEQNKRENPARAVMCQIRDEWAKGAAVPGYGTWSQYFLTMFPERDLPERYPFGFFPAGWSQSNLYRKQSSKAERKLARRGFAAAKAYLPHLIRSTASLRPLELITIDDFETDILVQARNPRTGRYEITTCTGLLALDVATRRRVGLGLKPRFRDEDDKKQSITRADVQGLLYSVFSEFGVPQHYGVTVLCENGGAAISFDLEAALLTLLGVQVARTGLLDNKVLANGFVERGGKPWEKGWIESTFNIAWNHSGAFAGQKGATYQLKPGDHEARLLYATKLLNTEGLTAEQQDELQTGFWKFDDALTAYHRVFDYLERRTNHAMEGFGEICDYALPSTAGLLTEAQVQKLHRDVLVTCTPVPRRECPLERWARLAQGVTFTKPADHVLPLLLLVPKKVKFEKLRVTFTHLSEGYTFSDADSPVMRLPEGTELLGYFDAANPNRIHVTQLDGRYVGPIRRRGAVDITNREAIALEQGEISRLITKHVLAPVRARHADEDHALATLKADNEAKLAAWGALPAVATPSRAGITDRLAGAEPCAQPRHAAAAASLAAGIAADVSSQDRRMAAATSLQAADELDATNLFPT